MILKESLIKRTITVENPRSEIQAESAVHLAYGIDENFVMPAGVSLLSVLENNSTLNFVAHIFIDQIHETSIEQLRELVEKYTNVCLKIYVMDVHPFYSFKTSKSFPAVIYFRILMPKILVNICSHLLYIDADVVCLSSIKSFLDLDMKSAIIAATNTGGKKSLNIVDGYFSNGLMWIDTHKWEAEHITEKILDYLEANSQHIFYEMDAMNAILYRKCTHLKPYQHCIPSKQDRIKNQIHIPQNAVFLHYPEDKPWTKWCEYPLKSYWLHYMDMSPWGGHLTGPIHYQQEKHMANFLRRHGKWGEASLHYLRYVVRKIQKKFLHR